MSWVWYAWNLRTSNIRKKCFSPFVANARAVRRGNEKFWIWKKCKPNLRDYDQGPLRPPPHLPPASLFLDLSSHQKSCVCRLVRPLLAQMIHIECSPYRCPTGLNLCDNRGLILNLVSAQFWPCWPDAWGSNTHGRLYKMRSVIWDISISHNNKTNFAQTAITFWSCFPGWNMTSCGTPSLYLSTGKCALEIYSIKANSTHDHIQPKHFPPSSFSRPWPFYPSQLKQTWTWNFISVQ